jgi:hypothetical protein
VQASVSDPPNHDVTSSTLPPPIMSIQAPATGIPDPEPPVEDGFDMKDADLTAPKDLEVLAVEPLEQDPKLEPSPYSKPCSLCGRRRNVLIRCQIDSTKKWHFICTGKCWKQVSGGRIEGDADHREYKYGGMWKNKHEYVSARIKGKAKAENKPRFGTQGPHRRHRKVGKNVKKEEGGKVRIGMDDGGSDIEVSDVSDGDSGEEPPNVEPGPHIQVKKADG